MENLLLINPWKYILEITAAEKDEGIVVEAKNGNVHIKAVNGNLILEGANVIIKSTDADGDLNL